MRLLAWLIWNHCDIVMFIIWSAATVGPVVCFSSGCVPRVCIGYFVTLFRFCDIMQICCSHVKSFAWQFMWELPVCKFCCCTAWLPRLGTVQDTPSAMQLYRWPGTLCHLPMVSKALRLFADGQQTPPSVNVRVWTGLRLSQTTNVHECASSGAGRVTRLHWHLRLVFMKQSCNLHFLMCRTGKFACLYTSRSTLKPRQTQS